MDPSLPNNNNNNNEPDEQQQQEQEQNSKPSLIRDFRNRLYEHIQQQQQQQQSKQQQQQPQPPVPPNHQNAPLDETQVQFLLEAVGGNVDLALGLYWEDSVARAMKDTSAGGGGGGNVQVKDPTVAKQEMEQEDAHETNNGGVAAAAAAAAVEQPPAAPNKKKKKRNSAAAAVAAASFLRDHRRRHMGYQEQQQLQNMVAAEIMASSVSDDEAVAERILQKLSQQQQQRPRRRRSRSLCKGRKKRRKIDYSTTSKINKEDVDEDMKEIQKGTPKNNVAVDSSDNDDEILVDDEDDDTGDDDTGDENHCFHDHFHDLVGATNGLVVPSRLLWGTRHTESGDETLDKKVATAKVDTTNDNDNDDDDDSSLSDIPPAGCSPVRRQSRGSSTSSLETNTKRNENDVVVGEEEKEKVGNDSKPNLYAEIYGGRRGGEAQSASRNTSSSTTSSQKDKSKSNKSRNISTDDGDAPNDKDSICVIPRTWLSAGFTLSSCGTGLVLNPPEETELARLKSIQKGILKNKTSSLGTLPLPPYHCSGITALLSIVTALLYSGATIQGHEVNCNSVRRKQFSKLSALERKREFPERLADALSSLLFIAAKEVCERRGEVVRKLSDKLKSKSRNTKQTNKKKPLVIEKEEDFVAVIKNNSVFISTVNDNEKVISTDTQEGEEGKKEDKEMVQDQEEEDGGNDMEVDEDVSERVEEDYDLMMIQRMHRHANLCNVCRWETASVEGNPVGGDLKIPLDQMIDRDDELKFIVSQTNVEDLRCFVLSNLRSYMRPGGCALFLETIVHIHGISRLNKMVRKARGLLSNGRMLPLASCSCQERQRCKCMELISEQQKSNGNLFPSKKMSGVEEQMPSGHECMSTELLSLLLTGKVHTDLTVWNAEKLGIGLLSVDDVFNKEGNIVSRLKSPPKPIWLIRGDVCYSTLWDDNMKPATKSAEVSSFFSNNSDSIQLTHWNSWYNVRNKSQMRVIPSTIRGNFKIPRISSMLGDTVTKQTFPSVSTKSDELNPVRQEENLITNPVTIEEIKKAEVHVDDVKYYPGNYHLWRFRFIHYDQQNTLQKEGGDRIIDDMESQKLPAWISYFRLNRRQKEIIERKLSPRINLAIWSKWPEATVDNIQPCICVPPIV